MTLDEIGLRPNRQRNTDIGSFAAVNVHGGVDGGPPEVDLVVETDEEHDFVLHPGDTFPVREQTWKLDRVENPGSHNWTVVLSRVK